MRREELEKVQRQEKDKQIMLEDKLPHMLEKLNFDGFIVSAIRADDLAKRDDYISLDSECMKILKNKMRELNDTFVLAS